jgi:hypothetical protein
VNGLARLRLRLTLWYGGVFTLILVLLGGGLFFAIRHQISRQLDASLRVATLVLERAARVREVERAQATGPVADAVDELHIPERDLYLFDGAGQLIKPTQAPAWIADAARLASRAATADRDLETPGGHQVRLHAERFTGEHGAPYVAVVAADGLELEDQYASLIEAFVAATLVALLLVAGGGYVLVQKSTAPVERSMEQMRRFADHNPADPGRGRDRPGARTGAGHGDAAGGRTRDGPPRRDRGGSPDARAGRRW